MPEFEPTFNDFRKDMIAHKDTMETHKREMDDFREKAFKFFKRYEQDRQAIAKGDLKADLD